MDLRNTTARYSTLSIVMHWLMLLMMVCVYAAIELHDLAPKGSAFRADMKLWHFMFGLCVLVLVAVRLMTRVFSGAPPRIEPPLSAWQQRLAAGMHVALYAFMFGMPFLGWCAVSAKGEPILFFGLSLPKLIGQNKALYSWLKDIHEIIATAGYYLIGLHAAAALFHHYVMRDNTLRRILPTHQ